MSSRAKLNSRYRIATVERFEEPLFTQLSSTVFGDQARARALLELAQPVELSQPTMLRIGAFENDTLVGWTYGWFERSGTYYMANSAVLPEHRRKGIYSALVRRAVEAAAERGTSVVRSRHVAANNAVLIAKLKLGFVITGSEFSEEFGLLIRLSYFCDDARRQLFCDRAGPITDIAGDG
ncbi:MAG: GNAT family N-acetyltransferase [Betaproteobacteria bacterium]